MTSPARPAGPATRRFPRVPRLTWSLLALALLLLFNLAFTPNFFHIEIRDGRLFGSAIDVLDRAAPLILVSIGMTLVIATDGVDLSVGAIMAISGAIAACLIARPESSILSRFDIAGSVPLVLLMSLGASLLAGAGNGLFVAAARIQPIVATLILMVAGRGVAQLLTGGQVVTFDSAPLAWLGNGSLFWLPAGVVIAIAALVAAWALVRGTALGLFIAAVGGNATAARHAGLPAGAVKVIVYAISGLLAGLAGLIVAADIQAADANNAGLYMELDAILAVVLGGTALTGGRFSLLGAVVGAVLIQAVTTTILSRGVAVEYTLVVKAAVIILVCLLQSPRFRAAVRRTLRIGRRPALARRAA
jgi:simple sugar transport system permease protein